MGNIQKKQGNSQKPPKCFTTSSENLSLEVVKMLTKSSENSNSCLFYRNP